MTKNESVDAASMHPIVHTPGPWNVLQSGRSVAAGGIKISQSSGPCAASANVERFINRTMEANARLIAAAPDLLAALEKIAKEHPDTAASEIAIRAICGVKKVV